MTYSHRITFVSKSRYSFTSLLGETVAFAKMGDSLREYMCQYSPAQELDSGHDKELMVIDPQSSGVITTPLGEYLACYSLHHELTSGILSDLVAIDEESSTATQKLPTERNMLTFWLSHFHKHYARTVKPEEMIISTMMYAFLMDSTYLTPTNKKRDMLFTHPDFYNSVKDWFYQSGEEELLHSRIKQEWKPKYFNYLETLLSQYGDLHSSLSSGSCHSGRRPSFN